MLFASLVAISTVLVAQSSDVVYPTPMATYDAKTYTTWDKIHVKGSKRGNIYVPVGEDDFVSMYRLDLVGDAKSRGFAHGALMAKEMVVFLGPKLDRFLMDEVASLSEYLTDLPEPLQKILKPVLALGTLAAPKLFKEAMSWVWEQEKQYVPQNILDEMDGMAEGVCSVLDVVDGIVGKSCNVTEWSEKIQQLNMLPELIRMACTAYGAWGPATAAGDTLIQVRALDFGGGPWANYTIVQVHRNIPNNNGNSFVSIGFPGFVGAITGISSNGIGISEKVWMTYNTPETLPGSYHGLADVFVLRTILETSTSRADAERYLTNVPRTWGIWVGIGDYETKVLDLVGYQQNSSVAYTDETMPSMTGQPELNSVCYVDKHPQPSHDGPTGSLPTALTDFYGKISLEVSKTVTMYHQTGDVHVASYDYGAKQMYLAIGRTNARGLYYPEGTGDVNDSVWMAYNRPYVSFDLSELWEGK